MLRRKFNVQSVTEEGAQRVSDLVKAGHSILVTPNHADHADPFVLNYIGHRAGLHKLIERIEIKHSSQK